MWIDLPAKLRDGANSFNDAGAAPGYCGVPATATVEKGERLFDDLVPIVRDTTMEVIRSD